ncbi:MAG: hypothetical protein R2685_10625 [Candidatus Nitrosocosmicus sp.]|nr:hypothetical protein [Candidatus Nitrosocosmicus sp.]
MSNLGDLISTVDDVIPPSVFNAKTIWVTDGDAVPGHDPEQPVGAVLIRDPGTSGFLSDHLYVRDTANSAWVDVFKNHLHTSDSDGGSYFDMRSANAKSILEFNFQNLRKGQFVNTVTTTGGTATITDQRDSTTVYTELVSPINTAYCDMESGGLRLFFGKPFLLQAKYKQFESTNILWRIGCGLSTINNSGTQAQVGFEGCGSNTKVTVVSANGTDRSTNDLSDMLQANPLGLRLEYYVDRIVGYDGLGGLTNKSDNLPPPSTATAGNATFRIGLKAGATTAGQSRAMRVYSGYLLGHVYDSESGLTGWI